MTAPTAELRIGDVHEVKVALEHGRSAIGIDLDARNADLARARVGEALTVVPRPAPPAPPGLWPRPVAEQLALGGSA